MNVFKFIKRYRDKLEMDLFTSTEDITLGKEIYQMTKFDLFNDLSELIETANRDKDGKLFIVHKLRRIYENGDIR